MQNYNNSQDFKFKVGDNVKVARVDEEGVCWSSHDMMGNLFLSGIVKECKIYKNRNCYNIKSESSGCHFWFVESSLDLISENNERNKKDEKVLNLECLKSGMRVKLKKVEDCGVAPYCSNITQPEKIVFADQVVTIREVCHDRNIFTIHEDCGAWFYGLQWISEICESVQGQKSETKERNENMQKNYKFEDFQIGEVVRVKTFEECMKFEKVDGYDFLYDDCAREEHCGKTLTIQRVKYPNMSFDCEESAYSWHYKWLEKIEPCENLQKSETTEVLKISESSQDAQNSKSLGELYEELYNEVYTLEGKLIEETQSVRKCIPLDLNFKLDVSSGGDTWEIQYKSKKIISETFDECEVLESLEIWQQFIEQYPTFLKICRDEQKKCESLITYMIQKCKDFQGL